MTISEIAAYWWILPLVMILVCCLACGKRCGCSGSRAADRKDREAV